MKIYLGSDHNGFHLKNELFAYLSKHNYDVEDIGDKVYDPADDFPQFAGLAATKVLGSEDPDSRAILICGGGQGMAMAANRFKGIRAAVIWDIEEAKESRRDNDSNVLALPARILKEDTANRIVEAWLNTPFEPVSRYVRRNAQLDEIV